MGALSIWHMLIVLVVMVGGFLPLMIKPTGRNRFGAAAEPQTLPGAVERCFKKYADFNGRASRSEYWYFCLVCTLAVVAAFSLSRAGGVPLLYTVVYFGLLVPNLAAATRRLHDLNRSGLWLLLIFSGPGIIGLWVLLAWPPKRDDDAAKVF